MSLRRPTVVALVLAAALASCGGEVVDPAPSVPAAAARPAAAAEPAAGAAKQREGAAQDCATAAAAVPRGADAAGLGATPVPVAAVGAEDADADELALPDGAALLRLAESDPSDRVRLRSLDALVALDVLPPPQLAALLDRLADDPHPAIADHARGLREGVSAAPEQLLPEAIE